MVTAMPIAFGIAQHERSAGQGLGNADVTFASLSTGVSECAA
jgi:hypothetical protein